MLSAFFALGKPRMLEDEVMDTQDSLTWLRLTLTFPRFLDHLTLADFFLLPARLNARPLVLSLATMGHCLRTTQDQFLRSVIS